MLRAASCVRTPAVTGGRRLSCGGAARPVQAMSTPPGDPGRGARLLQVCQPDRCDAALVIAAPAARRACARNDPRRPFGGGRAAEDRCSSPSAGRARERLGQGRQGPRTDSGVARGAWAQCAAALPRPGAPARHSSVPAGAALVRRGHRERPLVHAVVVREPVLSFLDLCAAALLDVGRSAERALVARPWTSPQVDAKPRVSGMSLIAVVEVASRPRLSVQARRRRKPAVLGSFGLTRRVDG